MKAFRVSNMLLVTAIMLSAFSCLRGAEPADEINVASAKWGATARASSEYGPAYAAAHALDSRWQVRETDKWNSAAKATPHWLLIDLGRPQPIHRIVIHHEGGVYITSDFQLQRGDTPDGPWTDLVPPIVGNKQEVSETTFAPTALRFLRLLITKAEQAGNEYARIFEVEAYASRKAVAGPLVSFDWVAPARYRKTGERVERLALMEILGSANGKLSLEVGDRAAVAVDPQAAPTEVWIPVCADQPVKAILRRENQVLVERTFAPTPETYFYNGGSLGIVSSSHQDTAWMDTPDFCRRFRIEQNIVPALEMMRKDPNYCFAMECTLHLMEFLEAHPERRDEILRLTREGRMEWGATYNQPYESWLSGEELIRQVYYGRRWVRKNLPGCDARVAFNPDVPGRALQMQQILAKAGVPYLFTSRYHEGLYRWLSPDGSGVLAYTPGHYGNHLGMLNGKPENGVREIARKLVEQGAYYQQRALPPTYCLVNSMDFSKPTDFSQLIQLWNRQGNAGADADPNALPPPVMGYTTFTRFFERIAKNDTKLTTLMGERPDVWLYIHGPTHHWTSSARREAARLLPAAETFTSAACLLNPDYSPKKSGVTREQPKM